MNERGIHPRHFLPDGITACLFDLDGVLTQTAKVHAAAWKSMFDEFLLDRSRRSGEPFRPFDLTTDYREYVDGKLRQDGVRSFMTSRGIALDEGSADDDAAAETIFGLGARKNRLFLEILRSEGVEVYEGSKRLVEATRDAGWARVMSEDPEQSTPMPFDGKRMFWGGFRPIFDTAAE